jgi:low affinity Fe/Cu permease
VSIAPDPAPPSRGTLRAWFGRLAAGTSNVVGSPWAFLLAIAAVIVWAVTGPLFGFSDTWQLVINTGTTIVTFLMVFLIQNTQNRDARAIHIKLDELLRAMEAARNDIIDVEQDTDEELALLQRTYREVREQADQIGVPPISGAESATPPAPAHAPDATPPQPAQPPGSQAA